MVTQEVEYKPLSVREILKEMKDLSSLMIDLAYSAFLYNHKKLAEEVMRLEERVDYLGYLLGIQAALAARDREDAEQVSGILKVATAVDKISDAAADIANLVLLNISIHPSIHSAFKKTEEILGRVKIKEGSVLANKTLEDLMLETRIGVDVIAVRREKVWILNPGKEVKLRPGDILIARGSVESIELLDKLSSGEVKELPEVTR
ncbi:MAG: potassium channel family protein [Candidatus Baldrarchaeota archaeon]